MQAHFGPQLPQITSDLAPSQLQATKLDPEQKLMPAIAKSRVHLFRPPCNNKDQNSKTTAQRRIGSGSQPPRQSSSKGSG
jgi:hypothetical protein